MRLKIAMFTLALEAIMYMTKAYILCTLMTFKYRKNKINKPNQIKK